MLGAVFERRRGDDVGGDLMRGRVSAAVVSVGGGRRGGERFLRVQLGRMPLFERLQQVEELHFELDRGKQANDHGFTEFKQRRPIDFVL